MVKLFLTNLMLSFIWVALTGSMYFTNFLFGYLLGFFILWVMNRNETDQRYFYRVPKIIGLILSFIYDLLAANVQVAYDVITPKYFFVPGIVQYPMKAETDLEINLLSTMIAMTPGTLIIDVSDDKKMLYIHVMYLKDKDKFINQIERGIESKLLEILR